MDKNSQKKKVEMIIIACVVLIIVIFVAILMKSIKNNSSDGNIDTLELEKDAAITIASQLNIAESLKSFDGIIDAKITITNQNPKSASIVLTTKKVLSQKEGDTIAKVVANSVDGLSVENILITDQDFTIIYPSES